MNEVAGWYEPHQKPARVGYYQRKSISSTVTDYWDGQKWILCDERGEHIGDSRTRLPWRELQGAGMSKFTPWYEPHQKPVRVGYYQRNYGDSILTSMPDYWSGRKWFICDAYGKQIGDSKALLLQWRGLRRPA